LLLTLLLLLFNNGSTKNNSSEQFIASCIDEIELNDAVGRATPNLTGAIKASAISHNSSIAIGNKAVKTRLHFL